MNTVSTITIAALAALTPTVTCLIGIILSRQDVRDLRSELGSFRTEIRAEMLAFRTEIRADMLALRNQVNSEMVALRNQVHADLLMIHERVAVVESKQSN